jgi:hypothetical protein
MQISCLVLPLSSGCRHDWDNILVYVLGRTSRGVLHLDFTSCFALRAAIFDGGYVAIAKASGDDFAAGGMPQPLPKPTG